MNLLTYPNSKGKSAEKNPGVFKFFVLSCILAFVVLSFNFLSPAPLFAQCQSDTQNQGLISSKNPINPFVKFGNLEGVCVAGDSALYREVKVPKYEELENLYYVLNRSDKKKTVGLPISGGVLTFSGDGIYLHNGNLTITSNPLGSGAQVIFVKGAQNNLNITGDINYADTNPNSGLVFIVEGNINISSTVRKINAVLISFGQICTAYLDSAIPPRCADGINDITLDLTIYGSLISFYKTPQDPPPDSIGIKFRRNLVSNLAPAEIINQQPKYLYILRDGLFSKDLIITTEDRHYQIPL